MIVQTELLTKQYGAFVALDACCLQVVPGEVYGLLGPNGAGKTTLLRLLMGFLRPTRGRAMIAGWDCTRQAVEVHRRVSYLPGDARLFRHWTGRRVLEFFARARGRDVLARGLRLAERLELDLRRSVARMSSGMRQKLALVVALAPPLEVLILDEPTTNLDPTIRQATIDLVREARAAGQTVIFSSHVLDEVEAACDRVGVMRGGHLVHVQPMQALRDHHRVLLRLRGPLTPPPATLAATLELVERDDEIEILSQGSLAPLLQWLAGLPLADVRIEPLGLRAVYDRYHPARPRGDA